MITPYPIANTNLKLGVTRVSLGLTQDFVAEKLNINPSHISNIEGGRAKPSLTALVNIANVLHCSVDYFIGEEYTFQLSDAPDTDLDQQIQNKLNNSSKEKKKRILKMIDLL